MKINTRTTNLLKIGLGAVVSAFFVALFYATPAKAVGVPSSGFVALQATEGAGMAILGLAIGAGLAIGLAGIGRKKFFKK